jgi:fumarylacetoacetate (FAA) hydrolase
MKLASLKGGRDGRLVVVSRDLNWCADASRIASTLQHALDDWERCEPMLRSLADEVEAAGILRRPFRQHDCTSPLPRAYQWADGSAYVNHVQLVRQARGAEMPASFWTEPLMYQGGGDGFLGPHDPIPLVDEAWGCDFEGEVAVITGDVALGVTAAEALSTVRLVMLANDVSLRNLIPAELAKSFGFFQSKPASAFSPVAVTPDELGEAWKDGKLHGALEVQLNGEAFGRADAGVDMTFDFGRLIAHAAKTRRLGAGSIIGSGTVSNRDADGGPGRPIADGGLGYSCIAELRTVETLLRGAPETPFLKDGDQVRLEMRAADGRSIFGAIDQAVARCAPLEAVSPELLRWRMGRQA